MVAPWGLNEVGVVTDESRVIKVGSAVVNEAVVDRGVVNETMLRGVFIAAVDSEDRLVRDVVGGIVTDKSGGAEGRLARDLFEEQAIEWTTDGGVGMLLLATGFEIDTEATPGGVAVGVALLEVAVG